MTNKKELLIVMVVITQTILACSAILPQTVSTSAPIQPVISTLELPQGQIKIPQSEATVPRVSVEDAKSANDSGQAIIVDVRSAEAYADSHVKGAINIPLGNFESNIENVSLNKEQWIITYCTWQNEHTSARAAFLMLQNGFTKVTPILGGLAAWTNAGFPIEP